MLEGLELARLRRVELLALRLNLGIERGEGGAPFISAALLLQPVAERRDRLLAAEADADRRGISDDVLARLLRLRASGKPGQGADEND